MSPKPQSGNKKASRGVNKDPICKFCKRKKSAISWRGNDGLQCRACPRVIATRPEYSERKKADLEVELTEGSDEHTRFLNKVEEWEAANPYTPRSALGLSYDYFSDCYHCVAYDYEINTSM